MRGVSQKLSPGVEPSSVEYECRSGQASTLHYARSAALTFIFPSKGGQT